MLNYSKQSDAIRNLIIVMLWNDIEDTETFPIYTLNMILHLCRYLIFNVCGGFM